MGVDVNLYAVGDVSDDELAVAEQQVAEALDGAGFYRHMIYERPCLVRTGYPETPEERIEFLTWSRYWGPTYPRGHWPAIAKAIEAVKAALPGLTVFYGRDSDDYGQEVTDDLVNELSAEWETAGSDD